MIWSLKHQAGSNTHVIQKNSVILRQSITHFMFIIHVQSARKRVIFMSVKELARTLKTMRESRAKRMIQKTEAIKTIADQSKVRQGMLLQEFLNVWMLTQDEPDFPRKLLKYYNISATSDMKLKDRDILLLLGKCFTIKPRLTKQDKELDNTYSVLQE